jgi:hypothetical protein
MKKMWCDQNVIKPPKEKKKATRCVTYLFEIPGGDEGI